MKMTTKKQLLAASVLMGLCGVASAATLSVGSATAQVGGGATNPATIAITYQGNPADVPQVVGIQCDIVTPAGVTVTAVSPASSCGMPGGNVRVATANDALGPLENGTYCNITYTVDAGAADGDTFALEFSNCEFVDADFNILDLSNHTFNGGSINVIAEGPPVISFDTTPIALPAGGYGTTQSATIPATITPGEGAGFTASFSCVAPAGFTVNPTSGGPYDNSVSTLPAITVSTTLTNAVQSGDVVCTATDSEGGSEAYTIPVSAPAGTESAPVLSSNPASGAAITMPVVPPGSTSSTAIVITPTGGLGTQAASVTCDSEVFTVVPNTALSFPVGSSSQSVQVQCTASDVEQFSTVTCSGADGDGDIAWTFDVTCPAGVNAPTVVPATSLWSKFALVALFAGLGAMLIGFRRQH